MDFSHFSYLRGREDMPSYDDQESDDPYAMIFVVNDNKEYIHHDNEVVLSVIHSMIQLLGSTDPKNRQRINTWLNGRVRKLVKRGRGNKFTDAVESVRALHDSTPFIYNGSENVAAFAPLRVSEVPAQVRKLQLTGLVTEPSEDEQEKLPFQLTVTINSTLNMTVSKKAVQAAHAVQLFIMKAEEQQVIDFLENGCLIYLDEADFTENEDSDYVYVHDAGFTEIPSGSLTARAIFK
jgi:peptidyl-tRNA hydrolase